MPLQNYRDISSTGSNVNAGFQFEFYCETCSRTWKSAFKPYRPGQFTALLSVFYSFLPGNVQVASRAGGAFSDMRARSARDGALAEALERAQTMFSECHECHKAVCEDCWDPRKQMCTTCISRATGAAQQAGAAAAGGMKCPNCQSPSDGGRFCAECGFDMASTHKSCPGCGALVSRQSRFCTDCGHGF